MCFFKDLRCQFIGCSTNKSVWKDWNNVIFWIAGGGHSLISFVFSLHLNEWTNYVQLVDWLLNEISSHLKMVIGPFRNSCGIKTGIFLNICLIFDSGLIWYVGFGFVGLKRSDVLAAHLEPWFSKRFYSRPHQCVGIDWLDLWNKRR